VIEVDGSHGEGGGQLVRTAAALAAITGERTRVTDIRAGRPNPGLAAQHVAALQAVAAVSGAEIDGLRLGSDTVVIAPGKLAGGKHRFDVGTAGSVTLILQAVLPPALLAPQPTELRLIGGTDVPWSPPLDYFRFVFLPLLARMGGRVTVEVVRRGYYPRGGGEIRVEIAPAQELRPLVVEPPGGLRRVRGVAHVGNLPADVAQRMTHSALRGLIGIADVKVEESSEAAIGPGGAIVLWAEHESTLLGASGLARKGVPAERLGQAAADELVHDLGALASLDIHAADQVLLYCALAKGESRFSTREISGHTETTMWLLEEVLKTQFEMVQVEGVSQVRVLPR
jgi:RNA 3'-phosphate cyclase